MRIEEASKMFRWLRGKPKPSNRMEPSLGRRPEAAATGRDLDPIEQMSLSEIIERISTLPEKASFGIISACLRRLYHIAFFEHGITDSDRENAAKLALGLKKDIENQLGSEPDKLAAFQKATQFTESQIAYGGINSLAWLLVEDHIPGAETIPFIMRPEHGAKLAPFLEIMDPVALSGAKPHMVRELVLQRQGRGYPNTVLHLHAIVCNGDHAALATFTKGEISALVQAPYNYNSARQVLVDLGLLAGKSNALPLTPPPEDGLLKFIVSQTALDTFAEKPSDIEEKIAPPENMMGLDLIVPTALCLHLGLTMIEALYGAEKRFVAMDGIEAQFSKAAEAGLLRLVGMMSNFEKLALTSGKDLGREKFSLDQMMIFAAWQEFGQWPETEEQWAAIQPYLRYLSQMLRHFRADYLIRLRCYLRFFIHGHADTSIPASDALAEIRKRISDLYVQYGSRAGVLEAISFGEDWIGTSS